MQIKMQIKMKGEGSGQQRANRNKRTPHTTQRNENEHGIKIKRREMQQK